MSRLVDFTYDSVHNRTRWTDTLGSIDVSYSDNALNQYNAVGGVTPTYDSRGNLTTGYGGPATLSYDCENRLISAGIVSFGYDLLGRRNRRTIGIYEDDYVWDGAQIIAEYRNGSLIKKYIYGPGIDNPVAMIAVDGETETWYYYYADALGSIRLITDAGGYVVEGYAYDVYGKPRVMTSAGADNNWLTEDVSTQNYSSIGNPYMFTGRRWYNGMNLYYYRFRDYAPDLGRFLQTDPAGYLDTMNLYAYCANNPVNWIDPWGLDKAEAGPPAGFPKPPGWGPGWEWIPTDDPLAEGYWKDPDGGTWRPHPDPEGGHGGDHWDYNRPGRRGTKHKKKIGLDGKTMIVVGAGTALACYGIAHLADWITGGPSGIETAAYGTVLIGIVGGANASDGMGMVGGDSAYPNNDPSDIIIE